MLYILKDIVKKSASTIGDDSWIGVNTIIQPGIITGKCCII